MQGSNNPSGGLSCSDKAPRVNWTHHVNAIQSSSGKDDFLSTSFLFSLPTQRPNPEANCEGMLSLRYTLNHKSKWVNSGLHEKAWRSLCNTQVACKSYLRPGLSAKVKDWDRGQACTYQGGSNYINKMVTVPGNRMLSHENLHQSTEKGCLESSGNHQPAGVNFCTQNYQNNNLTRADITKATNQHTFTGGSAEMHQTAPITHNMCTDDKLDAMDDDDDILASIDVDRIVMEHYQSTNTPRGSASHNIATPPANKCNSSGLEENKLPQELSELCSHQCKVERVLAVCPQAMDHLQEMKDKLIEVSNELLDGDDKLSPQYSEELRQKRVHLKKQIHLLMEHMASSTQDAERQQSHSMASTTAIYGYHPPMTPHSTLVIDNDRVHSQVYIRNGPDVNYTEGSNDKRWSSTNFPWTKDLETKNKSKFGNRSFRRNQREIINATMSGNDVFVLMPTGGGKSLTYQLPALISDGITLVVCPLVSLIQDQIMHLSQANIPATYLSANMEWSQQQEILRDLVIFRYFLRPKTKKCLEDIDCFIRANHFKECGIIYCLSRMDCEKVADKLRECGHKVAHYHGTMDPAERAHVQKQWSKDKINIICATVAFGMGINKPDVRFVIHHSLPKSIEGYHQVSYCENDVDCRRLLQLIHFGEMFDPSLCAKTCDNCLKELRWVERDVTDFSRQLVELVTMTRQSSSSCHILEVFRGSLSQNVCIFVKLEINMVKKQGHHNLALHGAGRHLAKGEAARIMRYLVTEGILVEDVKKSDNAYGSVSSVLKVSYQKVSDLCSGKQRIVLKFPTPENAPKMGKLDESSFPKISKSVQQQSEVDENLASMLLDALVFLRDRIMDDCGEGVQAYHIFKTDTLREMSMRVPRTKEELLEINGVGKVKVKKYGDRVLATIEDFLSKHPNPRRNSNGSNEHTEAAKKRRGCTTTTASSNGDDFEDRTVQSKKRAAKMRSTPKQAVSDAASMVHGRCLDTDLDGFEALDDEVCIVQKPVASGRVLPKWKPAKAKLAKSSVPASNLFQEFGYVK
ncbi:hypothetical protein PR202_gb06177 [Eleusine coracana subsp. coracana]|uniref:DNA 3'-5' helicase n=1 Tax=Eleusine coracana subsp. coracana TaxID=191504 RepID=A0AAV5E8W5_ELECO|nr:hypothetical protein PR202_gb06177 [Eleusine coracana subsp. coracana]